MSLVLAPVLSGCQSIPTFSTNRINFDREGLPFSVSQIGERCVIRLTSDLNPINPKALTVLEKALSVTAKYNHCREKILWLDSRGGDPQTAMKIAELIRRKSISTLIPAGKSCASACAHIFIGGSRRFVVKARLFVGSELGVHRPKVRNRGGILECTSSSGSEARDVFIFSNRYLEPLAAEQYTHATLSTDCDSIRWLKASQLLETGIATDTY